MADRIAGLSQMVKDLVSGLELDFRRRQWLPFSTNAKVKECIVWRGPCFVKTITGYNAGAQTWYGQAFNSPFAVIEGANTVLPPLIMAAGQKDFFDADGMFFDKGLYLCGSSTDVAKTIITTNDLFFYGLYRPA